MSIRNGSLCGVVWRTAACNGCFSNKQSTPLEEQELGIVKQILLYVSLPLTVWKTDFREIPVFQGCKFRLSLLTPSVRFSRHWEWVRTPSSPLYTALTGPSRGLAHRRRVRGERQMDYLIESIPVVALPQLAGDTKTLYEQGSSACCFTGQMPA
jgi:hypothetical protein